MKKNNIFRSFAALMTGCAMFMVSCGDQEPEGVTDPVFPSSEEKTVAPGQKVTLAFEANLDWEVSVPESSLTDFWIEDGLKVAKVSGKAGAGVVTIGTTANEDYYERSCAVTMTMGGKSQQIAKIIILSKGRSLKVYVATFDEDGLPVYDDGYVYSDTEAESIDLYWSGSDFRIPVRIDANYSWTVKTPSWASVDVPEDRVGEVSLNILGVSSEYPLEDAEGKIQFMAGETVVKEYVITIPGCQDIFEHKVSMGLAEVTFNYAGRVKTDVGFVDGPVSASVSGTSGVKVFAVESVDGKFDVKSSQNPSWLDIDVQDYDLTDGAEVLQDRAVTITAATNEGDDRSAVVFFLPPSAPDRGAELFNPDLTAVKDEYMQYSLPVTQLSSNQEFILMVSSPSELAAGGAVFNVSEDAALLTKFGQTKYAYELVYTHQYASDVAHMIFSHEVTSYKVFDASGSDRTSDEDFFLSMSLNEEKTGGVIYMDSEVKTSGFVVLYGSTDNVLAVVRCALDPETSIGDVADVSFLGESAYLAGMVGATLEEVTEGPLYDKYKENMVPIYHLKYTMENMPMLLSIPTKARAYVPNPYGRRDCFLVNGLNYDETIGEFERIDGGVQIYMKMPDGLDYIQGALFFYDARNAVSASGDNAVLVLVCTLDLTGGEE